MHHKTNTLGVRTGRMGTVLNLLYAVFMVASPQSRNDIVQSHCEKGMEQRRIYRRSKLIQRHHYVRLEAGL